MKPKKGKMKTQFTEFSMRLDGWPDMLLCSLWLYSGTIAPFPLQELFSFTQDFEKQSFHWNYPLKERSLVKLPFQISSKCLGAGLCPSVNLLPLQTLDFFFNPVIASHTDTVSLSNSYQYMSCSQLQLPTRELFCLICLVVKRELAIVQMLLNPWKCCYI